MADEPMIMSRFLYLIYLFANRCNLVYLYGTITDVDKS